MDLSRCRCISSLREPAAPPLRAEVRDIILAHLESLYGFYGEETGVRIARKHIGWYCERCFSDPEPIRRELMAAAGRARAIRRACVGISTRGLQIARSRPEAPSETWEIHMTAKKNGRTVARRGHPRHGRELPLRSHAERALSDYFTNLNGSHPAGLYDLVLREVEEPLFRAVLDYAEGNQSRAADILGINRGTLRKKLRAARLGRLTRPW